MSNFFTAIKILKALGMIKASESQSENSLVDAISKNFRISKTDTEDPFQFIDAWVVSYESGKFDSYLDKRKERVHFYNSLPWIGLRNKVIRIYPKVCMICKIKQTHNNKLQVDHIKPRYLFPELALDISNLGIICKTCNLKKSSNVIDDYRSEEDLLRLKNYLERM